MEDRSTLHSRGPAAEKLLSLVWLAYSSVSQAKPLINHLSPLQNIVIKATANKRKDSKVNKDKSLVITICEIKVFQPWMKQRINDESGWFSTYSEKGDACDSDGELLEWHWWNETGSRHRVARNKMNDCWFLKNWTAVDEDWQQMKYREHLL